ncbi:WD40 repeat domain-containing protein, partial [Flectobacillus roseus]
MRIALITLSILLNIVALAQKPSKKPKRISFEQKIQVADKLFKEGKTIESIQSYNIARILAGTDNAKHTVVDKRIEAVFKAIEKQKEEALQNEQKAKLAETKAKKSEQKAQKATNNAKALFVASEAGKVNPIQGLRLIEKVMPWTNDTNRINTIKEAKEEIFRHSNNHQFQEKRRYTKTTDVTFSQDSQWLITKDVNKNSKVWSVQTGKHPDFLKDEKNIDDANFSEDSQWLITRDVNFNYKVWSVQTGKCPDFFKDEKIIIDANFTPNSQWLITRDVNFNSKVWSVQTGKYYDFLKDEKIIRYANFSPNSQWLITTDDNFNSKVWSVQTGKYYDFLKDE